MRVRNPIAAAGAAAGLSVAVEAIKDAADDLRIGLHVAHSAVLLGELHMMAARLAELQAQLEAEANAAISKTISE